MHHRLLSEDVCCHSVPIRYVSSLRALLASIKSAACCLHPIHTIPGYSQWRVTCVVELKSALVHTTAQNYRPIGTRDSVRRIIMHKNKRIICYSASIGAMLKLKRLKAVKRRIRRKKLHNGIALVFLQCQCTNRTNQLESTKVHTL